AAVADLEHREAGLHEHHQDRGDDDPDGIRTHTGRLVGGLVAVGRQRGHRPGETEKDRDGEDVRDLSAHAHNLVRGYRHIRGVTDTKAERFTSCTSSEWSEPG